jgi:hypothetical protein
MFIIDDSTTTAVTHDPQFMRGAVPRDYATDPSDTFRALPSEITVIPRSEWSARCKERADLKSGLRFLRDVGANGSRIPSLDQNGQGFCWAYSTGMALMMARLGARQPYKRLSPHAVACKIKGFRDEGGWCGLSAKFARETGYPTEEFWPQKSMSRSHDTAATWADAAKYKTAFDYADLTKGVWENNLTIDQLASVLLTNQGAAMVDFNWWGHSVCAIDFIEVEAGSFGLVILNSWTDGWGDAGIAVLRGQKMLPDGCVAIVNATAG